MEIEMYKYVEKEWKGASKELMEKMKDFEPEVKSFGLACLTSYIMDKEIQKLKKG